MNRETPSLAHDSDLAAAVVAGLVVLVSFGIFHTLWILSIPRVFLEGILFAALPVLALRWIVRSTRRASVEFTGPRGGLLLGLLLWLALVPFEVAGVLLGPWQDPATLPEVLPLLPLAVLSAPAGAVIGWILTRRAGPTVVWAIGTTIVWFYLGGAIAFFGGRGVMLGLFLWLLPTCLLAGLVFVVAREALVRRAKLRTSPFLHPTTSTTHLP